MSLSHDRIAELEQECMIGAENAPVVVIPDANDSHLEVPAQVRACAGTKYDSREGAQTGLFDRLHNGNRAPVVIWPCAGHWHLADH